MLESLQEKFIAMRDQPFVLATIACCGLVVIGSIIGWFTIGNELARAYADTELGQKEGLAIMLGIVGALTVVASFVVGKSKLAFVAVTIFLYCALMISNQMPDEGIMESLQISTNIGFWLALLGSFGAAISSGMIGFKGFATTKFQLKSKASNG